jgi:FixJ family two-component response regulator
MTNQNKCVFILSQDEEWSEVSRDIIIGDGCHGRSVSGAAEMISLAKQFSGECCLMIDCSVDQVDVPAIYQALTQSKLVIPFVLVISENEAQRAQILASEYSCAVMFKRAGSARQRQAISEAFGLRKLVDHQMAVKRNHERLQDLSDRERNIVDLVVDGAPNKQIASKLGLSIKTIERVRQSAYRKLDVRSTAEMTKAVILGDLHDILRNDVPSSSPTPVFAPVPPPMGLSRAFITG